MEPNFAVELPCVDLSPPGQQEPGAACLLSTNLQQGGDIGLGAGFFKACKPVAAAALQVTTLEVAPNGLEVPNNSLFVRVQVRQMVKSLAFVNA